MTTPPGMPVPYINPQILTQAPTGISWNTIPFGTQVQAEQRAAEQMNICSRATSIAEGYLNQTVRATISTEFLQGPDYYATVQQSTGNMRLILSRWPVINAINVQVSPNCFPRSWTALTADFWMPEVPVLGQTGSTAPGGSAQGGQGLIISGQAGGGWWLGRNGFVFQVEYLNGWPHTQLTATADAGATTISVDDCTGWFVANLAGTQSGARGNVFDNQQESVMITGASVTSGPGTLTLANALSYNHDPGVMVSAMPQTIQWACILMGTAIALTRGATATSVHSIPGGQSSPASRGPEALMSEAELLLHSYRRVI